MASQRNTPRGWNTPSFVVSIARTHYYTAVDVQVRVGFLDRRWFIYMRGNPSAILPLQQGSNRHASLAWSMSTNFHFVAQMWPRAGQGEPQTCAPDHSWKISLDTERKLIRIPVMKLNTFFTFGELNGKVPNVSLPSFHWVPLDQLQCAPTALTLTPILGLI